VRRPTNDAPARLSPWELAPPTEVAPSPLFAPPDLVLAAGRTLPWTLSTMWWLWRVLTASVCSVRTAKRRALRALQRALGLRWAADFVQPVDVATAPGYYLAVAYPMCLTLLRDRVQHDYYRRIEVRCTVLARDLAARWAALTAQRGPGVGGRH
jgi:hypothetical protein